MQKEIPKGSNGADVSVHVWTIPLHFVSFAPFFFSFFLHSCPVSQRLNLAFF